MSGFHFHLPPETPLEMMIRERTQIFRAQQAWAIERWAEKAHAEIHAMAVVRRKGLGQMWRHMRVKILAKQDFIPTPHDPDYMRVIQAVNARYVAALTEQLS